MSIVVACGCGKRFAAPPKLAGKTVKCPSCGGAIRVPAATGSSSAPGGQPMQGATRLVTAAPSPTPSTSPQNTSPDLFDGLPQLGMPGQPLPADPLQGGFAPGRAPPPSAYSYPYPAQGYSRPRFRFNWKRYAVIGGVVAASAALLAGIAIGVWALIPTVKQLAAGNELEPPEYVTEYPHVPGAVAKPPKWLIDGAPFDAAALFKAPPEAENAAPLYLDALTEFDASAADCFPPQERDKRRSQGSANAAALSEINRKWTVHSLVARTPGFKTAVAELKEGCEKVRRAQERPACMFPPLIGLTDPGPHMTGSLAAGRGLAMEAQVALERGDLEAALVDLECDLRLAHDLRSHGSTVAQLVAGRIEEFCFERISLHLISHPAAKAENCDRIIALIEKYDRPTADCLIWAMQADYLTSRAAIMGIQHRSGEFAPGVMEDKFEAMTGKRPESMGEVIAMLSAIAGGPRREAPAINTRLEGMDDSDYQRELALLSDIYKRVAASASQPYSQRRKVHEEIRNTLQGDDAWLLGVFLLGTFPSLNQHLTRQRAQCHATKLLVAIRRWQLQEGSPLPDDLESVAKAAGLEGVPRDPFGDGPIRLIPNRMTVQVYSIGSDGIDDGGNKEARTVDAPGDAVFEMRAR